MKSLGYREPLDRSSETVVLGRGTIQVEVGQLIEGGQWLCCVCDDADVAIGDANIFTVQRSATE